MELEFPQFVEKLIYRGAAAPGTDAATYIAALVAENWNGRKIAEMNSACRLPEINPAERRRSLLTLLEERERRHLRERVIPITDHERP